MISNNERHINPGLKFLTFSGCLFYSSYRDRLGCCHSSDPLRDVTSGLISRNASQAEANGLLPQTFAASDVFLSSSSLAVDV